MGGSTQVGVGASVANDSLLLVECIDTDYDGFGDFSHVAFTCPPDNWPTTHNPEHEYAEQIQIGDICEGCCVDHVGDANQSGADEPTIGDASIMIDAKFIHQNCESTLTCLTEADINQSGGTGPDCDDITIGDISTLIDYLFITGPQTATLADCL